MFSAPFSHEKIRILVEDYHQFIFKLNHKRFNAEKMILFLVKADGDCFKPKFRNGRIVITDRTRLQWTRKMNCLPNNCLSIKSL